MTIHTGEVRRKVGDDNLVRFAASGIADRMNADERDYEWLRSDLLDRAVTLAADVQELTEQRPRDVERLTSTAARADAYPLRKQLERTRGLEAAIRSL
jgi:hypothetical protein